MIVNSVELKNFTVFENLSIDTSNQINIFIGENGTGKTHLLKAIYTTCEVSKNGKEADTLKKCFKNYDSVILAKNKNNRTVDITLKTDSNNKEVIAVSLTFDTLRILNNNSTENISTNNNESSEESYQIHFPKNVTLSATFIPSKDMLTFHNYKSILRREEDFQLRLFPQKIC